MTYHQDPYLANSAGYSQGINEGVTIGREQGYTQGWNEATRHGNGVVAKLEQEIERLSNEIRKGNAEIRRLDQLAIQFQKERDQFSKLYGHQKDSMRSLIKILQANGVNVPMPKNL